MPVRPVQALLPLFATQLAGGGAPVGLLAAAFGLLGGLGPAMWHMWIYLGSANANFYYAITLLFGAWQARLAACLFIFCTPLALLQYAPCRSNVPWLVLTSRCDWDDQLERLLQLETGISSARDGAHAGHGSGAHCLLLGPRQHSIYLAHSYTHCLLPMMSLAGAHAADGGAADGDALAVAKAVLTHHLCHNPQVMSVAGAHTGAAGGGTGDGDAALRPAAGRQVAGALVTAAAAAAD